MPGERCGPAWNAPRAPGKWSPSQISEHVARSLEESANVAAGRPSKFPKLPAVIHPLLRGFLFTRVLRKGAFPKAKTNKAMNPVSGPATAAEGRARLETSHDAFDAACRRLAAHGEPVRTTIFGAVASYGLRAFHGAPHAASRQADGRSSVAETSILMAYDERLANRIRRAFADRRDFTERKMFGRSRPSLPGSNVLRHRRE